MAEKKRFVDRIEDAIALFSPKAAIARRVARLQYEAPIFNRLRPGISTYPKSSETPQYQKDRVSIMMQARDLAENEPIVRSILKKKSMYAFGRLLYQSKSGDPAWDKQAETYFNRWSKNCDLTGRKTLRQMTSMAWGCVERDGDIGFTIARPVDGGDLFLQPVESDRIGNPLRTYTLPKLISGIVLDDNGRPENYHIWRRDPVSNAYVDYSNVPASSFLHIFDPERMDSYRGVSSFASSIKSLQDLHAILDNERAAVKLGSTITGLVKNLAGQPDPSNFLADTQPVDGGKPTQKNIESLEAGTWRYLAEGEDVEMFKMDRPSTAFQGFTECLIRMACCSVNMPYEIIWDFSKLGGTGTRAAIQQAAREIRRCQDIMAEMFLDKIRNIVLVDAIVRGLLPPAPGNKFDQGVWHFPASISVDLGRESAAAVAEIAAGMMSYHQWYGEAGLDADEQLENIRQEREMTSTFKPPMATSVKEQIQASPQGEVVGKPQGSFSIFHNPNHSHQMRDETGKWLHPDEVKKTFQRHDVIRDTMLNKM